MLGITRGYRLIMVPMTKSLETWVRSQNFTGQAFQDHSVYIFLSRYNTHVHSWCIIFATTVPMFLHSPFLLLVPLRWPPGLALAPFLSLTSHTRIYLSSPPSQVQGGLWKGIPGKILQVPFLKIFVEDCEQDLLDRFSVEAAVQDPCVRLPAPGVYRRSLQKIFQGISKQDFWSSYLYKISEQDFCSLHQVLCTRSLNNVPWQYFCTRPL